MTTATLSGDGKKTPLDVTALLDANGRVSQTRAADKEFSAIGDELKVMLRHVTWTGKVQKDQGYDATTDAPISSAALISKLVTFTAKGSAAYTDTDEDILPFEAKNISIDQTTTNQAATLETTPKLYWDDFSVGAKGDAADIRTDDHYLQSYYGYCYNGGTPSTALTDATGVLGWKVETNQTNGFTTSDLLWSPAQKPVRYDHATANQTENHGQVVIPFLHAMSKVTINVIAGDGFATDYGFQNADGTVLTGVKLNQVRTSCTATAPTATLDCEKCSKGDVTMKPGTGTGTRSFEAIIVPSILTVGNTFATITDMDGNTYSIPVTEVMVKKATENNGVGWGDQLDNADEDVDNGTAQAPQRREKVSFASEVPRGNGHEMRSGVHYVLNVTVNKTEVNVSATILDWDEVFAEGVGEIHFDNDIKTTEQITEQFLKDNGFDVYMSADNTYGTRTTHLRYNKTTGKWKYDPVIYWQGGTAQYFRALSNVRADAEGTTGTNESLIMENGRDALWGTTAEADGYTEGQPVDPRTGDVPLKFYHAMSKITFNLVDANAGGDALAKLHLEGSTIQLTNLATGGTLNLSTGEITPSSVTAGQKTFSEDKGAVPSRMGYFAAKENESETHYDADVTLKDYIITPQTIGDNAQVIVTLADGTVYKAQLNLCTSTIVENGVESHPKVEEWKSGKSYIYTITLAKEQITFRALVEDWSEKQASGDANLEWD